MELKFRSLRADEIECRVSMIKDTGLSLLLYKDARVDQNILDETVGPLNWQRHHTRDNANCIVSIWDEDKKQWIEKEDTGKESNTEAEKGLASDSFKRACFNFGIGRELYTAPFIWIPSASCNIKKGANGKPACYDRFDVSYIKVDEGQIVELAIDNESRNQRVYEWRRTESSMASNSIPMEKHTDRSDNARKETWIAECKKHGLSPEGWASKCGKSIDELTSDDITNMLLALKKKYPEG